MTDLIMRDLAHIWHPCSQMKDYETFLPQHIVHADGSYLTTADGRRIIDAVSSWWCKSLGHQHPALKKALINQSQDFEQIIFANTIFEKAVLLSEKLTSFIPILNKVFYASEGSAAVEIALKMSLHLRHNTQEKKRTKFMALQNGYHGETLLALSVSDVGIYKTAYETILLTVPYLQNIPYVLNTSDPLWTNCESAWKIIESQLQPHEETLTAIIVEPLLQGAGGMRVYSADFLKQLRQWTQARNIHLIADEIMTGCGRLGYPFACQVANIEPDFICLGKGLTGGVFPLSAVLTTQTIFDHFYDDYGAQKAFLHSHTHSGNALGVATALACLTALEEENIYQSVQKNNHYLAQNMMAVAEITGKIENVRSLGFMAAADLITTKPRAGYAVFQKAVELGAWLRPLGNTIYWLPPLNTDIETLDKLKEITVQSLACIKN